MQYEKNKLRQEYIFRINKAIDYIQQNLYHELDLYSISRVANFSQFHFHRLFKSIVGETLNNFINRIRLEKAAFMLSNNINFTITEVAFKVGFSSSQNFTRAFKKFWKKSPSQFKKEYNSKIGNINSKYGKDFLIDFQYKSNTGYPYITFISKSKKNMKVQIKEFKPMQVAYVRHIGPYKGNEKLFEDLFGRLCGWAGPRNLIGPDAKFLCIYNDDPDITHQEKLRVDVCIVLPQGYDTLNLDISTQEISGGQYAIATFEVRESKDYEKSWSSMYKDWLPQSGYQPADLPCFEMYDANCQTKDGYRKVDICIPVKAL